MSFEIGIVNYNGGSVLKQCLDSVLSQRLPFRKIHIWDNASTSDRIEEFVAAYPQVNFVFSDKNLGYAHACNELAKMMVTQYIVFANMDCVFSEDWHSIIVEKTKVDSEKSVWGSMVVLKSEPAFVNALNVRMSIDMNPFSPEDGEEYSEGFDRKMDTFGIYGAVMVFKKADYIQAGLMDESYFLYYEETDLFWRFQLLNLKIGIVHEAIVWHYRSWSTQRFSLLKLFYSERNRFRSAVKYMPLFFLAKLPFYSVVRLIQSTRKGGYYSGVKNQMPNRFHIILTLLKAWFLGICYRSDWEQRSKWSAGFFNSPALQILRRFQ
jgi:GT2 family glycosyltransferase